MLPKSELMDRDEFLSQHALLISSWILLLGNGQQPFCNRSRNSFFETSKSLVAFISSIMYHEISLSAHCPPADLRICVFHKLENGINYCKRDSFTHLLLHLSRIQLSSENVCYWVSLLSICTRKVQFRS